MLVWVFAYDQVNYSRHFSYNWATQQQLHLTHPAIYHKIIKYHFSVKRARGNFNKLPPDQVIEQTINKEQKGSGGIIGISTSDGAIEKWILSSYIIAGLMANIKESVNLREEKMFPKMWAKRGFKMMRKFCSIAAVTSKVGKIHLSIVGKLLVFHHKSRHHQQLKKI